MARKFLYGIVCVVVLVIAGMFGLRFWAKELSQLAFVPGSAFSAAAPVASGAYADPALWIARGNSDAHDPARWQPRGAGPPAPVKAAVFFVHPTSHYDRSHWNAALSDAAVNARAETFVRGLASPFAGASELWAPRYRQATFGAFIAKKADGQRALDLAYGDVLAAFDAFVAAVDPKAPLVLVGHSQGALHLLRLLHDRAYGQPLARRIAAAYVIGWPVSMTHDLPQTGLHACAGPDDSGCLLSWQSYAEPADPSLMQEAYAHFPGLDGQARGGSPMLCTNPLTGTPDSAAPASANLGTLMPDANLSGAALVAGMVPARCSPQGFLLIGPAPELGPFVLPGNNYHIYDIPLFWGNIRADFARRVTAWKPDKR